MGICYVVQNKVQTEISETLYNVGYIVVMEFKICNIIGIEYSRWLSRSSTVADNQIGQYLFI